MACVVRSPLALEDMQGIWDFIAADNRDAADRTFQKITKAFDILAANPLVGEQYADDLRRFVVGSYLIFYRPIEDGIEVVRIFHGARRYDEML